VASGADEDDLPAAAADYARELAAAASDTGPPSDGSRSEHPPVQVPRFDVVLLGMGPDSHVASLFPGRAELEVTDTAAVPVTGSPKPPPLRVSLTVPALRASRAVWFVVTGADKAEAVSSSRRLVDDGGHPASWARGTEETVWWLDEAAATGLPDVRPAGSR
jgi:6-phosphogluconolactonase/glucosamine-6-phosphate isomerase/deaminase